jgi:serine/threonine protein kinase
LDNLIKKQNKPFTNSFVLSIIHQLFDGVNYIHKKGFIHRDLKPGNIFLLKNTSTIKIGDLGLAKELNSTNQDYVGTISYMSPEQRDQKNYCSKVDIWALGFKYK